MIASKHISFYSSNFNFISTPFLIAQIPKDPREALQMVQLLRQKVEENIPFSLIFSEHLPLRVISNHPFVDKAAYIEALGAKL